MSETHPVPEPSTSPNLLANLTPQQRLWIAGCLAYPAVCLISIAAANVLLVFLVLGWITRPQMIPLRPARGLLFLVGLYLAWTIIAVALSPYGHNWRDWLEERSTFLALLPGLALGKEERWLRKSFFWISLLILLFAVYATYQFFYGWDLLRGMQPLKFAFHRYHATGLQNFHLTFGGLVALSLPLSMAVASEWKYCRFLLPVAGAVCVVAAMARSIMLGLAGCGVLFLILGSRRLRVAGIVLVVALLILPETLFTASGERLAVGLGISKENVEQGDPTRLHLWKSALNIIRHYPLTGIGEGNWHAAFDQYKDPYKKYSSTARSHNDFLDALVFHGIPGGMLLLALWGYIISRCLRAVLRSRGISRDLRLALLASFLMILFGGLFQGYQTDAEIALLLWFLVGVSVQLPIQASDQYGIPAGKT